MKYAIVIQESLSESPQLEKQQYMVKLIDRVQFIRYLKEGTARSQAQSAKWIDLQKTKIKIYGSCISKKVYKACLLILFKVQQRNFPIVSK